MKINSKMNRSQKRLFTPKLTNNDTIAFVFLAAERGLTPEQLIESFVHDIVSSFYVKEITEEEKHLVDWFNRSWFSQDNDGYFSFLQFVICNDCYFDVLSILRNMKLNQKNREQCAYTLRNIFKEYCIQNPAHKSFKEEIKTIVDFKKHMDMILKCKMQNHH